MTQAPGLVSTVGHHVLAVKCSPWVLVFSLVPSGYCLGRLWSLWEVEPSWRKWLSGRRALRSIAELTSCPAVLPTLWILSDQLQVPDITASSLVWTEPSNNERVQDGFYSRWVSF